MQNILMLIFNKSTKQGHPNVDGENGAELWHNRLSLQWLHSVWVLVRVPAAALPFHLPSVALGLKAKDGPSA